MTCTLPPPLASKTSLSSLPPLPGLPLEKQNRLTLGNKGKSGKRRPGVRPSGVPPGRVMSFVSRSGCLRGEKVASVSEGWAGRVRARWRISEEGEGRRFPATFRQSGVATPARALWLSSSFPGRLHQNLPRPPTPTHTLLASLALTSTRSGTEGLEPQSFSYWGARRLCASMARDGLKGESQATPPRPASRAPSPPLPRARFLTKAACQ